MFYLWFVSTVCSCSSWGSQKWSSPKGQTWSVWPSGSWRLCVHSTPLFWTFMGYKTYSRFFSPVYGAITAVIIKCKYTDILKGQVHFQSSYNRLKLHFNFMWVPVNTRQKLVGKTIIYIINLIKNNEIINNWIVILNLFISNYYKLIFCILLLYFTWSFVFNHH